MGFRHHGHRQGQGHRRGQGRRLRSKGCTSSRKTMAGKRAARTLPAGRRPGVAGSGGSGGTGGPGTTWVSSREAPATSSGLLNHADSRCFRRLRHLGDAADRSSDLLVVASQFIDLPAGPCRLRGADGENHRVGCPDPLAPSSSLPPRIASSTGATGSMSTTRTWRRGRFWKAWFGCTSHGSARGRQATRRHNWYCPSVAASPLLGAVTFYF